MSEPPYLIVNADDFGYFRCVSRGIAQAHVQGLVTATGVLANLPGFERDVGLLTSIPELDLGVHLNLTAGEPLSARLKKTLARYSRTFPSKAGLVKGILTGSIKPQDVEMEWTLQIERCLEAGLELRFLNSHEHMHMLPGIFPVIQRLAVQFEIKHVRLPSPDSIRFHKPASLLRDLFLHALAHQSKGKEGGTRVHFLGMGVSGRLSLTYLEYWIPRLLRGEIYELMCHPGLFDPNEITDRRLRAYHNWQGELEVLTNPTFRALLDAHGVRLIRYRDVHSTGPDALMVSR